MNCRKCGYENPDGAAVCENCGEPLEERRNAGASWGFIKNDGEGAQGDDLGTDDIDELEMRFSDGVDEWQPITAAGRRDRARRQAQEQPPKSAQQPPKSAQQPKENPARPESPAARAGSLFDEANEYARTRPVTPKEQPSGEQKRKSRSSARDYDFEEYDPAGSARKPVAVENGTDKKRGGNAGGIAAIVLVLLAIAGIVAAIAAILSKGIGGNTPNKNGEISINPNDPNMYIVTVHAKEGSKVVFEFSNGQKTDEFTVSHKNGITFSVAASDLIPVEPIEGETCEVSPKVYLKQDDGSLAPIEMPSVIADVPKLDISFETPDEFVGENGLVQIKGKIQRLQREADITVEGEKLTVEEDGSFLFSKKMDKGEYELNFLAQLGGHMIYRKTFKATVNRQLTPEEIVVIPKDFVTRALNVEDSIRVSGKVPVGAKVSVVSGDPLFSLKSQPEVDEQGNFSFEVNLPTASKAYPFTIVCTLTDGTVYERPFSVERPPLYNEYVPTVWPDNYEEMIKPIHVTDLRGFVLKGTITEILRDDDYLTARMTLDSGGEVIIEYHNHYSGATELTVDGHFTMYGYSLGMDQDNTLHMFIWFVQD